MLGDGGSVAATSHSVAISDRDPLHVHASVTQVLERKSDARALGDLQYRAKFSVSHKGFSPGAFMQVVHSDTSYADLVQGARLLRESMSQGSEALKILVHNNFDRFVDARNKIDLLYEEMKSRSLNSAQEYGTRAFGQALQDTTQKADEIYNPIIDRRARAEKIRATLSVVERYKFYFNLPFSLIEYTRKGKFDIAVREYKKGRQLLQAVTSGNIGSSAAEGAIAEGGESGATGLSRIFQHVWKEVQESVVELRNALFRHLSQAWRAYGEQETVIRHLLEIDPGDTDPVAFFLEHQHKWIVGQMHDVVQSFRQRGGQDWRQSSVEVETAAEQRADELTRALRIES
ncbi:Exocyst complex component S5, partial [Linderina pennispora]